MRATTNRLTRVILLLWLPAGATATIANGQDFLRNENRRLPLVPTIATTEAPTVEEETLLYDIAKTGAPTTTTTTAAPEEEEEEEAPSSTSTSFSGFSSVRPDIPDIPILDGIYVPMSNISSDRYEFMKLQYETWFRTCAPNPENGILRGDNTDECWRYDPSKTLYEFARRVQGVEENSVLEAAVTKNVNSSLFATSVLKDAQDTAEEFLSRQNFSGSTGGWPDCSGGVGDMPEVDQCDMKYWGHASSAWFRHSVDGEPYAYSTREAELLKEYCFEQGWGTGPVNVDELSDVYTERQTGLTIQCLIDLYKANATDVSAELATFIDYQYAMVIGNYSGQVIGAPMHSLDGHECSGYCPDMRYWVFSPWMGSSFLIPALWEYYVFVDQDPRIAEIIVLFGGALMDHGVVRPGNWTHGARESDEWMLEENPTGWTTLYFGNPYNLTQAIQDQDSEGWFSDSHNPEAIFALSAAYFFSCNPAFLERVEEMWGFFNSENAVENSSPLRLFLWQHRGSASTEWLLENASCVT